MLNISGSQPGSLDGSYAQNITFGAAVVDEQSEAEPVPNGGYARGVSQLLDHAP